MPLSVAIQMDPLATIDPDADSSFALALEAQRRGHGVFHYTPGSLALDGAVARATARPVTFTREADPPYSAGTAARWELTAFDVVLMRQDPPFDMAYITATHILDAVHPRPLVVNDPAAVRNAPEKLFVTRFPELIPPTLIGADPGEIAAFREAHGDIIVKPLFGNGGTDIFRVKPDDENLTALLEMFQRVYREPLIAQRYLPEIRQGDKRILLVEGEPVGAVNRLPAARETRANFHAGGRAEAADLGFNDAMLDAAPDDPGQVLIPAWRHALISLQHPILERGLRILDTPGLNALGSEPELTVSMLPSTQAVVFLLAAAVVFAVAWPSRPSVPWSSRLPERLVEEVPSRGQAAAGALIAIVLALSLVGVVTHLQTVESTELPNDPVEVQDYQIGYSENVTNQLYSVVDVPGLDQATSVDASGVIVYSERRNVWQLATSKSGLASRGYARVTVGGVGWRETVWVTRTSWSVVGGSETYRVRLHPPDEPARLAFASDPATAEAIIANRSITLQPAVTDFEVVVDRGNETLGTATLPESGANTTVADIRFERNDDNLYASYDGTHVRIANKKVPPTRQD